MIRVVPVKTAKDLKRFIDLPYALYRNDPQWVPPLKLERKEFFDPKKNPYYENAEVELFLALDGDTPTGRISAQVNRLHNERYGEKTAHFGCFESVENETVAGSLLNAAEDWAKSRGMTKITGPFSFSINEETGLLIEGFDRPPFPFMAHNPAYYGTLLERNGYVKIKDLIAWIYDLTHPVPEAAAQIADVVRAHPGLTIREVDLKNIGRDLGIISDVFHSAWAKNWGFIPWTDSELKKMAKDLKLILEPKLALIAEVDGKPAAISICIPNYHEAIRDLNGRLLPFGIFKLLYRLKIKKPKSTRLALLGIKKEFRNDVLAGLSVLLYVEMHRRGEALGHWGGELSWTLDDNDKINHGISLMGGVPYKKYRVFEKSLSS
jgi:hypothetical protein